MNKSAASRKTTTPSGVSEVEYRRALNTVRAQERDRVSSSTVDAAALQQDMARRFNLSSGASGIRRTQQTQLVRAPANQGAARINGSGGRIICECCKKPNSHDTDVCTGCGYFLHSLIEQHSTLSQRRGLSKPVEKVEVLTSSQWDEIENKLANRTVDACCPICMEGYNQGQEVVLSCSHMFHRTCLQAFEKFMKNELSCPICRTKNYQKKLTHQGTKSYEKGMAVRIQSFWRGCLGRALFHRRKRLYYRDGGGELGQRKKYYETELSTISSRLTQNFDARNNQVDRMLSSMDRTMSESKQLDDEFERMLANRAARSGGALRSDSEGRVEAASIGTGESGGGAIGAANSPTVDLSSRSALLLEASREGFWTEDNYADAMVDWEAVRVTAEERGACDCAICMLPIKLGATPYSLLPLSSRAATETLSKSHQKSNIVLSCSHIFHQHCIGNFEKFIGEGVRNCPICRSTYVKRCLFGASGSTVMVAAAVAAARKK